MDQAVILVIIALISLVNWLMKRSAELREKKKLERQADGTLETSPYREQPDDIDEPPLSRPIVDPAAEMRKLMEALGLPMEEVAPPVVTERPPALPKPEPVVPRFTRRPSARPDLSPARKSAAVVVTRQPGPLATALSNPQTLRQAIVLRTILGPAKGLPH